LHLGLPTVTSAETQFTSSQYNNKPLTLLLKFARSYTQWVSERLKMQDLVNAGLE